MPDSKAAKFNQQGTPLIAVVLAVIGWYEARDTGEDAAARASRKAESAEVEAREFSEVRLRRAWRAMEQTVEAQDDRIRELEIWIIELEGFVEEHIEEDTPRAPTLTEIRAHKSARANRSHAAPRAALPSYDAVQEEADFDDIDWAAVEEAAREESID